MNQEIRRKLDRITDILWAGGVTNPVTYIEQLSYLINSAVVICQAVARRRPLDRAETPAKDKGVWDGTADECAGSRGHRARSSCPRPV